MLETIGCNKKAYQESKRGIWELDDCMVLIDEWSFLDLYLEVKGRSEECVKFICEKLGFYYSKSLFCSVNLFCSGKYGFDKGVINN